MNRKIIGLSALLLAVAPAAAFAQGGATDSGTGGASERMKPSTVGTDPRPDDETLRARQSPQQSIQAQPPVMDPTRPVTPPPNPPAPGR